MSTSVAAAAARLAAAGVPSPRHDAEALAAHLLGIDRGRLAARLAAGDSAVGLGLDGPIAASFDDLVRRRAQREPLQHLTGKAPFRYLELAVGPGVFVPRPETEVVAGWCLDVLARMGPEPLVVDICAGSGAIGLAVADECSGARVYAVEADDRAVAWTRRNAEGTTVVVVHADAATALADLDGTVDVVVANPPYVPDGENCLDPEARDHDPPRALSGGPDGLDGVRLVTVAAARLLRPGGVVAIEHHDTQGQSAPAVLTRAGGWLEVTDHRDLAGRDRFVTAVRQEDA